MEHLGTSVGMLDQVGFLHSFPELRFRHLRRVMHRDWQWLKIRRKWIRSAYEAYRNVGYPVTDGALP